MNLRYTTAFCILATLGLHAQVPCDSLVQAYFTPVQNGTLSVSFTNNSIAPTVPAPTWWWEFGDGSTSPNFDPTHIYLQSGTYTVCLVVTWGNCTSTYCHEVLVGGGTNPCDSLNAAFSASSSGLTGIFANALSSNNYTYHWTFGDGSVAYGADPSHTYSASGAYHVCLIMWAWNPLTQDTCFADHCEWVTVQGGGVVPCDSLGHASFTYANNGNLAVSFSNTSIHAAGAGTAYFWSFGDGSHSDQFDPTHTYAQSGTYTACVTQMVWILGTSDTCSSTYCHIVHAEGGGGTLCDSLFTVDFNWGYTGTNSIFYSANTTPFAGGWLWHFGDGTSSDAGPQGTHEYPGSGTYELCLTAWYAIPGTSDSCTHTTCHWVTIGSSVPCDSLGHASFTYVSNGANTATFTNTSFHDAGTGTAYFWAFGDGTYSQQFDPMHTYSQSGTYTACLTQLVWIIGTSDTCSSTYCHIVHVEGGGGTLCDSLFTVDFIWGPSGTNGVFYSANTTPFAGGWLWHFGDGTSSDAGPQGTHLYGGSGTYELCLTAWYAIPGTSDTCTHTTCHLVTIAGGSPCDQLNATFTSSTNGLTATFQSGTNIPAVSYQWFFGDGSSVFAQNASHTYAANGTYHACLIVGAFDPLAQDSCFADHCMWVTVQDGGVTPCDSLGHASFTYANNGYFSVVFNNVSYAAPGTGTSYSWAFGDGTYSDQFDATHTYPQNGNYTACLTQYVWLIGTTDTCSTIYCHIVHVDGGGGTLCDSLFTVDFTWGNNGTNSIHYSANTTPLGGGWLWHFGDGASSDAGPQGTHEYLGSGTYDLCLTAWYAIPGTSDTCTHTTCHPVIIGGGAPCDSSLSAYFTWETNGLLVHFHDGSTTNGQSVSYAWAFGDGGYSTDQNATHTYSQTGVFHPCLTITTINSLDTCSSTFCHEIHVLIEGVEEAGSINGLSVAPQPFSDAFTLSGHGLQGETLIMLFDAVGRLVDDRKLIANGSIVLDYSTLPPATYLMRVRNADNDRTVRLMKR